MVRPGLPFDLVETGTVRNSVCAWPSTSVSRIVTAEPGLVPACQVLVVVHDCNLV